ncbi:uncharacterized protein [Spinacia oleracea]|uniref:Uncharacterized protein isoform X5 n=1 Tax=Spinacia oleracea TaxID=3562 RepID=A0ABM3R5U6_SPIOL|nr:uncharacterized protein LOC110792945 isoform X5 [Spinacia oleracea]
MVFSITEFKAVTKEICKLPSFFSIVLFQKIDVNGTEFVTSVALMRLAEMDYCGTTRRLKGYASDLASDSSCLCSKVFKTPKEGPFNKEELDEVRDKWATYFNDWELPSV